MAQQAAVLLSLALAATALPAAGAAAPAEGGARTNWQDGWREDLKSCMRTKRELFVQDGKPIDRELHELPGLLTEMMMRDKRQKKGAAEKKMKPKAPKPSGKLSKKERMRQELLGSLSGSFNSLTEHLPEVDQEQQVYGQQAGNFIMQAANRAKLGPTDKVTLSEFCDVIWRAGRPSPLDPDEPERAEEEVEL